MVGGLAEPQAAGLGGCICPSVDATRQVRCACCLLPVVRRASSILSDVTRWRLQETSTPKPDC